MTRYALISEHGVTDISDNISPLIAARIAALRGHMVVDANGTPLERAMPASTVYQFPRGGDE